MSPLLKQFFLEIHEWIEQGCPEHDAFLKTYGLCDTLKAYIKEFKLDKELLRELFLLLDPIKSSIFPFNTDFLDYLKEHDSHSIYQNPARLAFIKQQVEMIKNTTVEQLK